MGMICSTDIHGDTRCRREKDASADFAGGHVASEERTLMWDPIWALSTVDGGSKRGLGRCINYIK